MLQTNLGERVASNLAPYACQAQRMVVAYSGGVDSSVLLHIVMQLYRDSHTIVAVYCNHQHAFGTPTDQWQAHAQAFCRQWSVHFRALSLRIDATGNTENAARQARYEALSNLCQEGDVLLLAHHACDQHETVLEKLARGASLHGLLIPHSRRLGQAHLARPLLTTSKEEIIAYARAQRLQWIEDSSNTKGSNTRARMRSAIIPRLADIWPRWQQGWVACEHNLSVQAQALSFFLDRELAQIVDNKGITLAALASYPRAIAEQLVLHWIRSCGLQLPTRHSVMQVLPALLAGKGQRTRIALRGIDDAHYQAALQLYQHRLWLHGPLPKTKERTYQWKGITALNLPQATLHCACPPPQGFRVVLGAEQKWVQLRNRAHHTSMRKLWQAKGIPTWERAITPQVLIDQQLVYLGDVPLDTMAHTFAITWKPHWRLQPMFES